MISSGNPLRFRIPGGVVRYSTAAFYRNDGRRLEGHGILPDRVVRYTVADYQSGVDPDRSAAEALMTGLSGW